MAFYTPAAIIPCSPDAMNATLPSIINSWASWRASSSKSDAPITPPMTSTFQSRTPAAQPLLQQQHRSEQRMTLPPIAHLERHLPPCKQLTPPEDIPQPSRIPLPKLATEDFFQSKPAVPDETPHFVDWFDFTRTRPANFIAEKTCEMICYLWFAVPPPERASTSTSTSTTNSPPLFSRGSSPSTLQLVVTKPFMQFMQKLLETTQVSQSVIVLSLHYIHRLKERNQCTPAQSGSEFRIAVTGLMMANKFLDDNTYTNKTWSEVSGIELEEINRMEREFLFGVDFNLYVDKFTYDAWLNLLKGLVMAVERDSKRFHKSRNPVHRSRLATANYHHPSSGGPSSRVYTTSSRQRAPSYRHRARSTSPTSRTVSCPQNMQASLPPPPATSHGPSAASHAHYASSLTSSPTPRSNKRSAEDAFSPTSATFSQLPSKRPLSMSLQIPEYRQSTYASSAGPSVGASSNPNSNGGSGTGSSPLEGLAFDKMSLIGGHSPLESNTRWNSNAGETSVSSGGGTTMRNSVVPETLVTAYSLDEGRRSAVPQNLYFYSLACSPLVDSSEEEENRTRKARLRYHQPSSANSSSAGSSAYAYADMNGASSGALYNTSNSNSTLQPPQASQQQQQHSSSSASYAPPTRYLTHPHLAPLPIPAVVQSASTSPAMTMGMDVGLPMNAGRLHALPHFRDDVWARPAYSSSGSSSSLTQGGSTSGQGGEREYGVGYGYSGQLGQGRTIYSAQAQQGQQQETEQQMDYESTSSSVQQQQQQPQHGYASSPHTSTQTQVATPPISATYHSHHSHSSHSSLSSSASTSSSSTTTTSRPPIPSAPFANAGPPGVGVQFYPTPVVQSSGYYDPANAHGNGNAYGNAYDYGYYGHAYPQPHNPRTGGHASWVRMRNGGDC
ncbi:cyclin-domain-containing protein [Crassisporium funariophilum]|nr:cyclin-domain-containing protein [Crassisporium funariophilum]